MTKIMTIMLTKKKNIFIFFLVYNSNYILAKA